MRHSRRSSLMKSSRWLRLRPMASLFCPFLPMRHPMPGTHFELGRPSGRWTYRDAAGAALFEMLRFDKPDGDKEFRPLTLWRDAQGLRWRWKSVPPPRPLYNLHKLAARPDAPVVICEGEKSADAAARDFPEIGGDDFARRRERGRQGGLERASRAQGS